MDSGASTSFFLSLPNDVGMSLFMAIAQASSRLGGYKLVVTSRLIPYSLLCPHLNEAYTFVCCGFFIGNACCHKRIAKVAITLLLERMSGLQRQLIAHRPQRERASWQIDDV